jgi:hypothetical protein
MLIKADACAGDQIPVIVLPYPKPCIATLADAPLDAVQLRQEDGAEVPPAVCVESVTAAAPPKVDEDASAPLDPLIAVTNADAILLNLSRQIIRWF